MGPVQEPVEVTAYNLAKAGFLKKISLSFAQIYNRVTKAQLLPSMLLFPACAGSSASLGPE
jgi:hypothetical protein